MILAAVVSFVAAAVLIERSRDKEKAESKFSSRSISRS